MPTNYASAMIQKLVFRAPLDLLMLMCISYTNAKYGPSRRQLQVSQYKVTCSYVGFVLHNAHDLTMTLLCLIAFSFCRVVSDRLLKFFQAVVNR